MDFYTDKKPPIDFPVIKIEVVNVPVALFIVMAILATIGIIFAIILLRFNVTYRTVR